MGVLGGLDGIRCILAFRAFRGLGFTLLILIGFFSAPASALDPSCKLEEPYEAPKFVPPPLEPRESKTHLIDNGDGTLSDPDTGLMWAQKDSHADLKRCLNYPESLDYVNGLKTGSHSDWRIPTVKELATLYDDTQANVLAWDQNPDYPLALDKKFAAGAAYWYWSSDCGTTELTECCAKTVYFVNGQVHLRRFEICNSGGVRAVRNLP
ncbi:MAG: DUF1566 domain-containing protein [Nitrospinaceae bacterium]|jgi:hypothetical protein|nr:MAG: DUF1566 domain-containing protein [Nitrospinaceae bacterium]